MWHNLPGRGLGRRASSLIAYGLGTPFAPVVEEAATLDVYGGGGRKEYVSRYDWDDIIDDIDRRQRIMDEDEEILQIIITAISSGVLD